MKVILPCYLLYCLCIQFSGISAFSSIGYDERVFKAPPLKATDTGFTKEIQDDNDKLGEVVSAENNDRIEKIRFRGRATYDGSGFSGWQVQAKGRTCQGELESVLSQRFNRAVKIVGAGRTDTGVHARGQAFHFDLYTHECLGKNIRRDKIDDYQDLFDEKESSLFCNGLQKSLNSMLKQDMRVYNLCQAPPPAIVLKSNPDGSSSTRRHSWHVIYSAQKKLYCYRISLGPHAITNDPLQRYTRAHVDGQINVEELRRILTHFEGTHDFRAFAGAIEANQRKNGIEHKDTVRTVYKVHLVDEGEGKYRIDILLKGALYKMVRNMVGTALEVAKGRMKEEQMVKMLHHDLGDVVATDGEPHGNSIEKRQFVRKDNKCKPAAAEGLTMEMVYFDDDF